MIAFWIIIAILLLLICVVLLFIYYPYQKYYPYPLDKHRNDDAEKKEIDSGLEKINGSWIRKTYHDILEVYVKGSAYNRGADKSELLENLIDKQEEIFVSEIDERVPSLFYKKILVRVIAIFNRSICKNVSKENLEEIYGISKNASSKYKMWGNEYQRMLNYHAAHDIGHALQSYAMVGCSAFALWDDKTDDGEMLVGRNFDFYMGDNFAKEKIVEFVNPEMGYKFAYITWAGMTGVVSGMNDKGITVSINAGPTIMPKKTAVPVSLVAREILQYASTIEEAKEITNKRKIFVAESFLVCSASEKAAVVIEKTPFELDYFNSKDSQIYCTNHFQSEKLKSLKSNIKTIASDATSYRYKRLQELVAKYDKLSYTDAVDILKNKEGLKDENIGLGNEKALNQLLAHHGIVFKPKELKFWISTNPANIGEYICYDLNEVFAKADSIEKNTDWDSFKYNIEEDEFASSGKFKLYKEFQTIGKKIHKSTKKTAFVDQQEIDRFIELNPVFFETYIYLGDYYRKKDTVLALKYYTKALECEMASDSFKRDVLKKVDKLRKS